MCVSTQMRCRSSEKSCSGSIPVRRIPIMIPIMIPLLSTIQVIWSGNGDSCSNHIDNLGKCNGNHCCSRTTSTTDDDSNNNSDNGSDNSSDNNSNNNSANNLENDSDNDSTMIPRPLTIQVIPSAMVTAAATTLTTSANTMETI